MSKPLSLHAEASRDTLFIYSNNNNAMQTLIVIDCRQRQRRLRARAACTVALAAQTGACWSERGVCVWGSWRGVATYALLGYF